LEKEKKKPKKCNLLLEKETHKKIIMPQTLHQREEETQGTKGL
jgi:hypothetical protein